MVGDKRPTASLSSPRARKKAIAHRSSTSISSSSSFSSTILCPEYQNKGFFFEHNLNPDALGDHESIPFTYAYLDEMKMEAIYAPPEDFFPNLVSLFFQNISLSEMDGVRPFAIASVIGKTKIIFTPDDIAGFLGFPSEPPEDVDEGSLSVSHHVFVGPLAGGGSGPGGCTLRVDEPPKLWILDDFLKRNHFQVGHSQ